MAYAELATEFGVVVGDISRPVVSHDLIDGYALPFEPSDGPLEEGQSGLASFIGQDLDIGQPGGVIDAHVSELVAQTGLGIRPIAVNAVARTAEPSELLRVHVEELSRAGTLVSVGLGFGLEIAKTTKTDASEDCADGGARHREGLRDSLGRPASPAELLDPTDEPGGNAVWRSPWSRGSVEQTARSFDPEATKPLVDRPR